MSFIRLFFILIPITFFACAPQKVISFNNPDLADYSYQTYRIITLAPDTLKGEDLVVFNQLQDAVSSQMEARKYNAVKERSDLLVRYKLYANNRINQVNNNAFGSPWNRNLRGSRVNDPLRDFYTTTSQTTETLLLIDIHDRKRQKLVWQGSLDLNYSAYKHRKLAEVLQEVVAKIFSTYTMKNTSP